MNKVLLTVAIILAFVVGFVSTSNAGTFNAQTGVATLSQNGDTVTLPTGSNVTYRVKRVIIEPGAGNKVFSVHAGASTGQELFTANSVTAAQVLAFNSTGTLTQQLTATTQTMNLAADFALPPSITFVTDDTTTTSWATTPTLILHTVPTSER